MSRSHSAKGLTLIEMVVVLAILAVLAGVAVRSLEPIADQTRYEVTQQSLETLRNAVVDDRLQSSGVRQVSGFVADLGLLPETTAMLVDDVGASEFTSISPAISLAAFPFSDRVGPAAASPPANPTNVDCSGVALRCGWRGPYITATNPANAIADGWGRPFGLGEFPIPGSDVHLVWSAVTPQYNDLSVNVQSKGLQTVSGLSLDSLGAAKSAEVVLVYPNPTISTDTLVVMEDADGNNSDGHFRFENVPVGVRALVFKDPIGTSQAVRYIEVTPMQHANQTLTITEF